MVKPVAPKKSFLEHFREELEARKRACPVVETRYFVIEITPAYSTYGYYSQDFPEVRVRVSPYFSTKEFAEEWMLQHEPDEGKSLKIVWENLRRFTDTRWVGW